MKKVYWVKKDPNNAKDWIEMDGEQFCEFISSPEGKGRYFMDCETYQIEVTPEQYREWRREADHRRYLKKFESEIEVYSLDNITDDFPLYGEYGEEILIDFSKNTEDEAIHSIDLDLLVKALCFLSDEERWLIEELFLRDKPKVDQEISDLTGIPRRTVAYRKKIILEKLKKVLPKI